MHSVCSVHLSPGEAPLCYRSSREEEGWRDGTWSVISLFIPNDFSLIPTAIISCLHLSWFCSAVKEPTCQCRRPRFNPWVRKICWRRDRLPTPVFLPGKSNGQRSLAGFCDCKVTESDTTKRLNHNLNLAGVCIYFPEDISGFFGEHQQCILSFCGGFIF